MTLLSTPVFKLDQPFALDCGVVLPELQIAYQTYGSLNEQKSNAILLCHALTGDQFVAGQHPITKKLGWWDSLVGSNKVFDTNRYFVICSNVLSGCMGSSGPSEINPTTNKIWGADFPIVTIGDMVRAQVKLIDSMGIEKLFAVVGGSMGGMQVLQWCTAHPNRVFCAVPIATAAKHSAQNIAFHEVGRQAIEADPDWCDGAYLEHHKNPNRGLKVARMAAHITYLSEAALHRKFGRNLQNTAPNPFMALSNNAFQVESYLHHQGSSFAPRFDANSYFRITRAMDLFDLGDEGEGALAKVFHHSKIRFCVISFSSDWLFPTSESREIVRALNAAAANVSFVEIQSDKGHDAFLLDEPEFYITLHGFLNACAQKKGLISYNDLLK